VLPNQLFGIHIQLGGTHARLDGLPKAAQHVIEQRAGFPHAFDLLSVFQIDHLPASSAFRIAALIASSDRSPPTECSSFAF